MSPRPGDRGDDYDENQYPPSGIAGGVPSVLTVTYSPGATYPPTVAWFVNSWIDDDGDAHTFTISSFTNLNDASLMAYKLAQASQSIEQGSVPTGYVQSQFNTYSGLYGAYSSYGASPIASPSTAAQTSLATENPQNQRPEEHHGPGVTVLAVGIIVPIIVCLLSIMGCIFCVGHYRRKARRVETEGLVGRVSSEMREVGGAKPTRAAVAVDERAYLARSGDIPPTAVTATPATVAGARGQEPPVILSTAMDSAYYTGIDTSDQVSISDQRSMASRDTFGEEPPPPYRPRSVPPISRDASVRTSLTSTPHRNPSIRSRCETLSSGSILRRSNEVRSPFDDPEEADEDDVSEVSTIRGHPRSESDRLSDVSDLSYQAEPRPTSSRPHV